MASCCTTVSSVWVIALGVHCCACGSLDTVGSIRVRARIGEGGLSLPSPAPAYSTAPPFLYQAYRLWWILQLGGGPMEVSQGTDLCLVPPPRPKGDAVLW